MTDQTVPTGITPEDAKKAREWALHALNKPGASTTAEKAVARAVIATVPEPLPTLADMTPQGREACQWLQCDTDAGNSGVITDPGLSSDHVIMLYSNGVTAYARANEVTPRPDLPRMEWPGDKKPAPTGHALPEGFRLADHPEHGRVVAAPYLDWRGNAHITYHTRKAVHGTATACCDPEALTFLDGPVAPTPTEVAPGVTVGKPITDPDVIEWIDEHAPDGTIVEDRTAIMRKRTFGWGSGPSNSYPDMAKALGYGHCDWLAIDQIAVVRWGGGDQ